jgi:hypothetical protein
MSIQIIVIQVGLQFARQIFELIYYPLFKICQRLIFKTVKVEKMDPLTTPQYILDEELELWETRDEMSSKITQFGFIILFTAAFPFVLLFSNLNSVYRLYFHSLIILQN